MWGWCAQALAKPLRGTLILTLAPLRGLGCKNTFIVLCVRGSENRSATPLRVAGIELGFEHSISLSVWVQVHKGGQLIRVHSTRSVAISMACVSQHVAPEGGAVCRYGVWSSLTCLGTT